MIDIAELERIIAFAVPIESKDCKRVVAKKEWRREELKKKINDMIDKEAALKLTAMVIASSVRAHKERAKPVPDFPTGGVLNAPFVSLTGNHDRAEYIMPPNELLKMQAAAGCYDIPHDMFEQLEAVRKQRQKDEQATEKGKI